MDLETSAIDWIVCVEALLSGSWHTLLPRVQLECYFAAGGMHGPATLALRFKKATRHRFESGRSMTFNPLGLGLSITAAWLLCPHLLTPCLRRNN